MPMTAQQIKEIEDVLRAGIKNLDDLGTEKPEEAARLGNKYMRIFARLMFSAGVDLNASTDKMPSNIAALTDSLAAKIKIVLELIPSDRQEALVLEFQARRSEASHWRVGNVPPVTPEELAEAKRIGPPRLSKEQDELLEKLADSVNQFAFSRMFLSKEGNNFNTYTYTKRGGGDSGPCTYELGTINEKLGLLLHPLIAHINAFSKTHDMKAFKANCEKTFKETAYGKSTAAAQGMDDAKKSASFYVQAYDAVVYLFRAFFRAFDYMASLVTGKLMNDDKKTPYAQEMTGRAQFFQYYQEPKSSTGSSKPTPVPKSDAKMERFEKDFMKAVEALEKLTPTAAAEMKPGRSI